MTKGEEACVSLKEYFESRFLAMKEAVYIAQGDLNRRLTDLNNLRNEVITDRQQFVSRELHDKLQDDFYKVVERLSTLESRVVTIIGGVGLFLTLLQIGLYYFLHKA